VKREENCLQLFPFLHFSCKNWKSCKQFSGKIPKLETPPSPVKLYCTEHLCSVQKLEELQAIFPGLKNLEKLLAALPKSADSHFLTARAKKVDTCVSVKSQNTQRRLNAQIKPGAALAQHHFCTFPFSTRTFWPKRSA